MKTRRSVLGDSLAVPAEVVQPAPGEAFQAMITNRVRGTNGTTLAVALGLSFPQEVPRKEAKAATKTLVASARKTWRALACAAGAAHPGLKFGDVCSLESKVGAASAEARAFARAAAHGRGRK